MMLNTTPTLLDEMVTASASIEDVERELVHLALTRASGNQSQAARMLGISRYAIRYRMDNE